MHLATQKSSAPLPVAHGVLWRLAKADRTVEAEVRVLLDHCELRVNFDGINTRERVFATNGGGRAELRRVSREYRDRLIRFGWRPSATA
jgi:hypothetical protein